MADKIQWKKGSGSSWGKGGSGINWTNSAKKTSTKKKKENKYSKFIPGGDDSWLRKQVSDIGAAGKGLPTALFEVGKAVSPIANIAAATRGKQLPVVKTGKQMGKAQLQAVKDLKSGDAWKQHTAMNTLTALGIIAPVGKVATIGRAAALPARVAKGGPRMSRGEAIKKARGPRTRTFELAADPPSGRTAKRLTMLRPDNKVTVAASENPLAMLGRAGLDKAYDISLKRHKAGTGGAYARKRTARTKAERERLARQYELNPVADDAVRVPEGFKKVAGAPMTAVRTGMLLRPRYYLQNLIQSLGALGVNPIQSARAVKMARDVRKSHPDMPQHVRGGMGETGFQAGLGGTEARIGTRTDKLMKKAMAPEARLREVAFYGAARKFGVKSADELAQVMKNPRSDKAQMILREANERIVDYSRLGPNERFMMATQLPIFYPMFKGTSRWGGQFVKEHPTLTGALANLGEEGREMQLEGLGGEPQPWFPYLIPTSPVENGKLMTRNPQNIYPFSPPLDIAEGVAQMLSADPNVTRTLAQLYGPFPELGHGLVTGKSLGTGWDLKRPGEGWPLNTNLAAALADFGQGALPGAEFLVPRETKAYGKPDLSEALLNWILGPARAQETSVKAVRQKKNYKRKR